MQFSGSPLSLFLTWTLQLTAIFLYKLFLFFWLATFPTLCNSWQGLHCLFQFFFLLAISSFSYILFLRLPHSWFPPIFKYSTYRYLLVFLVYSLGFQKTIIIIWPVLSSPLRGTITHMLQIHYSPKFQRPQIPNRGRGRVVSIPTHYWLVDSGFESQWTVGFSHPSNWPWDPPRLLFYCGVKRPGCDFDRWQPPRAEVKERIELDFLSSSVPSWYNMWELYIYPKYKVCSIRFSSNVNVLKIKIQRRLHWSRV